MTAPSRRRRGQALVEFSLVAPIFFFLIFGIIDFGRYVYYVQVLNNGAREGARYATLWPTPSDTAIRDRISNTVFGVGVGEFGTPDVATPDEDDCTHCRDLEVTFTMTPNFLLFEGPEFTITRSKRVYLAQN